MISKPTKNEKHVSQPVNQQSNQYKSSGFGKKWVKSIGIGIKIPDNARTNLYIDKKCPFIGKISIRGRIIKGTVISTKMDRSIIVRRDYLHWIKKYKRYEKRHRNIPCHCSPCFRVAEGDQVTIGQCRPLSKTIRFNLLRIDKKFSHSNKKTTP
mmetsp:Transcript_14098/g.21939  ORF Transcript_14098/g.21939 Transcript_14098/m.21939 type:complete len:154 (+) Transcript_14098:53-514(+)